MKIILLLLFLMASLIIRIDAQSRINSSVLKTKPIPRTASPQSNNAEVKLPVRDRTDLLFADTINKRARKASLIPLKSKRIGDDDLEFRVWVGFGMKPLEGFVISRVNGNWKGLFLKSINRTVKPPYTQELSAPKLGWEELWKQLTDKGLLTLPDFSELEDMVDAYDGTSYVVEVKTNGVYQTYAYLNPDRQKWQEATQMLKIASILYSNFAALQE